MPNELSVILAVWDDYVDFLPDALASLKMQDTSYELIIVDNASRVPIVVNENCTLIRLDSRVTLGAARNIGTANARCSLVCYMDADDMLVPKILNFLMTQLSSAADLDSIAMRMLAWDAQANEFYESRFPPKIANLFARVPRILAIANAFRHQYPMAAASIHRREAIVAAGGFSTNKYPDDWALANALMARGRVKLVPLPGRVYRIHSRSLDDAPRSVAREGFYLVRKRLMSDPKTSLTIQVLMPLIRVAHALQVRRYPRISPNWSGQESNHSHRSD